MNNDENLRTETELDDIDKIIIKLKLEEPKITNQEIADRLNMSRQTISKRFNSPEVQQELENINQMHIDRFIEIREKALTRIEELIESSEDKVAVIACREFIKSIMPQKIEHSGHVVTEGRLSLIDYMDKSDVKNTAENIGTDEPKK